MTDQFNILDYTDGPLLKTGQTTNYTPAGRTTKDDGGFRRGIPGSLNDAQYVVYTTGQYSGSTTVTVNSINDSHSNACVLDKVTGLMWLRTFNGAVFGTGAQNLLWVDLTNNEDIFEYCDQSNVAGLAGFADWRVPNIKELASLPDLGAGAPYINQTVFPLITADRVWSSTTRATDTTKSLIVSFASGESTSLNKTSRERIMMCRLGINGL